MQDNPVALITGANQGIGLQIAKELAAQGFTVLVGSRNLERGEEAAREPVLFCGCRVPWITGTPARG